MTTRKQGGSRDGGNHDHNHDRGERERHPDGENRDFQAFSKVRGARWLGSAPPTAEAYARALALWRRLPGAVGVTTTDLGGAAKPSDDEPAGKDAP